MIWIKDILFPKFCLGCGFLGSYICFKCRNKLIKTRETECFYCKRKSYQGLTHRNCQRTDGVDGFIYIYKYDNLLKKIIKTTKYRYVKECFKDLLLNSYLSLFDKLIYYKKTVRPLSLEAIPLHESRLKKRGFNQSEIIADFLCEQFSFEKKTYLIKAKETAAQATLKRIDRIKNLKNTFSIKTAVVEETNILLIDDVVTTGATMAEAAKVLKAHGAAAVIAFALAKG